MVRVECKVFSPDALFSKNFERDLNKLAEEGWRVVAMGMASDAPL